MNLSSTYRRNIFAIIFLLGIVSFFPRSAYALTASDISALSPEAWYRGSTGVTTSSGHVTGWTDQSGNSHNVTISATNKPTYDATRGTVNLVENLADSTLNLPVTVNSQAFTMFIVSDRVTSQVSIGQKSLYALFSATTSLSGISGDASDLNVFRAFVNTLSGTLTLNNFHQGWSVVGFGGSASAHKLWVDDQTTSSASALSANTQTDINIGGADWNGNVIGGIKEIIIFDRYLSDSDAATVLSWLRQEHSLPTSKSYQLVADGDSLSYGTGVANSSLENYLRQFTPAFYNASKVFNFGIPSQNVTQMDSDASITDGVLDADIDADKRILMVYNADITHYSTWKSYLQARQAAGWKVVAGTTIAGNFGGSFDTDRLTYNSTIRSEWPTFADALADPGSDSRLGDYNNSTYYDTDKIHLTETGYGVVSRYFESAARSLLFATSTALTGPTSGTVGVASSNFTVQTSSSTRDILQDIIITPSDNGGGGSFTPSTVTLTNSSKSKTFTYTPASAGTKTISIDSSDSFVATSTTISFTASVPDTTDPTVAITNPLNGATVSGAAVNITADVSDNVDVVGVTFYVSTTTLSQIGAEDISGATPSAVVWDTTALADGSYNLIAVARDSAGNVATSSSITVEVDNVSDTTTAARTTGRRKSGPRVPIATLAPVTTILPQGMTQASFARDLQLGITGSDVLALQKFLNNHGFIVAASGPGSVGFETMKFGLLTKAALAKFQAAHGITPAVGYFGPKTRTYISSLK